MFPDHTWKEIRDALNLKYGVNISRKCVYATAKRLGVEKAPGHKSRINQRRKESERRRIIFGLPQRTRQRYVLDPKIVQLRRVSKSNLIRTNNYFSEPNSTVLYYDSETRRSQYLEQKYSHLFQFLPAEGFDPADSVWVSEHRNKWKTK